MTIQANQVELQLVIEEIQRQAEVLFFYSQNAIGAQRKVSCQYKKSPLKTLLDEMFPPLGIDYKLIDDKIVLFSISEKGRQDRSITQNDSTEAANTGGEDNLRKKVNLIKGRVLSKTGQPLNGASIVITGTRSGTVSNDSGYFLLETDLISGDLQISHTAYKSSLVNFSQAGGFKEIRLEPLVALMDEVVVIGYGSQTRRSITTSTSTVKGNAISDAPVGTVDAALQGRAPGVLVSQQGGSPGSPVRIQVRGTGSISSGTEPLYIIDGIYIFQDLTGISDGNTSSTINPLATLNPDDVASIEILKDAAATAIYGARGANGVIIITTKQGRKGKGNISISLNRGLTTPTNLLTYASGSEWLATVDQARANSVGFGISPGQELFNPLTLVSNTLPTPTGISGPQFGPNTDFTRELAASTNTNWRDMLLQQGQITDFKLSAGNGFQQGNFYLSGQYWDETGVLTNQRLQRFSFRANLDFNPSPKWRLGTRFAPGVITNSFAQTGIGHNGTLLGRNNPGATGGWAQVFREALPIMPVYNADGSYFDPLRGRNVAAGADPNNFNSQQQQQRFVGNAFAEFRPLSALTLRAEAGADFLNALTQYWVSDVIRYNRYASETGAFISNLSGTAYATYQSGWKGPHDLSSTAGVEWQKSTYRRNAYTFEGVQGSQQEIGEISNGSQTLAAVSGIFPDHVFTSFFVRGQYAYDRRLLASFSLRRDGSSVFSPGNRIGYFPSFSAGWVLSDENWYRSSSLSGTLSFLKLRSSFGQTGNASIPAFAYLSNFVNWPVYGQSPALSLSVLGNPRIRWEKNNQFDVALEAGFWNNRLHTTIEGFVRVSEDMLLNVPVAPTVGIGAGSQSVIINVGNLRNSGIEWELSGVIVENHKRKDRLRWSANLNLSWVKDNVLKLTDNFTSLPVGDFPVANGILQGVGITQIGGRLGTFYLAEYAGLDSEGFETIYEVDKEVLRSTGRTVRSGRVIRATTSNITNNRMVHYNKTGLPTWYGGFTQTLQWMGLELRAHLTFQGGNYIYDGQEEAVSYVRTGNNVLMPGLLDKSWRPDRPDAPFPRLTWNMRDNSLDANGMPSPQTMGSRTTRFLYPGDYLRLKTLSLSYNLPETWMRALRIQSARVYLSGQNLLTVTRYPGFDPEILVTGPGTQGRNLSQGFLTNAPVPQVKTVMVGINVVL